MTVSLSLLAGAGWQFFDDNGTPLTGGLLYTYEAGTTTPLTTYTDVNGNVANANPIVLDAAGRVPYQVWLSSSDSYKFILKTSTGVTVWTEDNIEPSINLAVLAASNGSSLIGFIQAGTGAVARTAQSKLRDTVSVKDFGAICDGSADDTTAVQAAFNYIQTNGGKLIVEGICAISAPLTIKAGAKWIIEGRGGASQGALKAIASMNWLIDMSNDAVTYEGEMVIRDVTFNGNNLSGGINANYARYSKFENLRMVNIESTKTGIKAGNWVNRITNCIITGGDKAVEMASPALGYTNNFVIDKNAFTSEYGVYISPSLVLGNVQYPNNSIIRDNTFDFCAKAAIFAGGFSRGLIITGNYIEACGGAAVPVETSAGVFVNRYGAMIFPRNYQAGALGWSGLRIYDNEFINCSQAAPSGFKYCVNMEKPTDVSIYDNVLYPVGTYDAFVGLSGVGATVGDTYKFEISHADPEGTLSALIKNDVTTSSGFGNFRAKFYNNEGSQQFALPDIFQNMASWTIVGPLTVTQSFSNGLNVINFNRSSGANVYYEETNANNLKMWLNRYLRFNGINKFVSPVGGNNLNVKAEIDTGSGYTTVLNIARTDDGVITTGEMFFVPPNTTKLKITVSPTVAGEINVYNLKLVDPANSL